MKLKYPIVFFLALLLITACEKQTEENTVANTEIFKKSSPSETGINFINKLTENDSLNYHTYGYIYMGGGVAVGDINNDGLIDLYFTGNMVPNKLYLNKGNMEFEDITESAGVVGDSRWYTGVTMADVNNDGYLDIYCSVGGKFGPKENQLLINNGDNTFTEQAEAYGIALKSNSVQATFFDYDLDGDLDLYVANYPPTSFKAPNQFYAFKQKFPKELETDRLFKNESGKFIDVTEEAGIKNFGLSLSATVSDLNKDGWPDVYVSNDFSSPDYMYINNKNGTFTDHVKLATKNVSFYGMGADIADFNNDNLPDIFQVDMSPESNRRAKANMASMNPDLFWSTVNSGFHYQYMQNSLQLNNGNLLDSLPDFSNISRLAGVSSTDWSWGPLFADLDNDGWKDIFVTNGTRREINNRDYFKKLGKGKIPEDSLLIKSLEIPSEPIDNYVLKNNRDFTFTRKNKEWGIKHIGFSNGGVYADLDNDGDLDIVTNNIDDIASVFENKSSEFNNYLMFSFKGPEKNPFGIGVKTTVYTDGNQQYQELTTTRGFQSSVAPQLHFGVEKSEVIDSVKVIWPDRRTQTLKKIDANTSLTVNYQEAKQSKDIAARKENMLFRTEMDTTSIVQHQHIENYYDDYEKEVLLPHQTSMFGPNVAVGDLNGDGKDDLVTGGSSRKTTAVYFQQENGFVKSDSKAFEADIMSEDMGIHIFDADGDGDNDIYIASGGNEFSPDAKELQDRLYINDGEGNFEKSVAALPEMITSSSRVQSHDFDKDGDLDLFVCGRLVPGNYPLPANSYLLENRSTKDDVEFVDVTSEAAPFLNKIGMATDVLWTDFDQDGWTDLIVVGEWMPITLLKNDEGEFSDVSNEYGLDEDTRGWWFSIEKGDFDGDGDMDYLVGNLGLNYKYKASENETFDVYFNDFDKNNSGDIVLSYFNDGKKFPVRGRECSSQQVPAIKKKFEDYESFSTATITDIYTEKGLENALHYQVKSFASVYMENKGGSFVLHQLPNPAQLSSINQILVEDFDKDGHLDALIAGNLHASEVETPRNDASNGLFFKGDGKGNFLPVISRESGFYAPGDVKDMTTINIKGNDYIVVAKNSDYLQFIAIEK